MTSATETGLVPSDTLTRRSGHGWGRRHSADVSWESSAVAAGRSWAAQVAGDPVSTVGAFATLAPAAFHALRGTCNQLAGAWAASRAGGPPPISASRVIAMASRMTARTMV